MKKLLFSAVALVAFSSVSMGNTMEIKDLKIKVIAEEKIVENGEECLAAKFNAYVDSRAAGFSVEDSTANSYSVYFLCMSLNVPPSISN